MVALAEVLGARVTRAELGARNSGRTQRCRVLPRALSFASAMSITSDEVNFLVYRYLHESGARRRRRPCTARRRRRPCTARGCTTTHHACTAPPTGPRRLPPLGVHLRVRGDGGEVEHQRRQDPAGPARQLHPEGHHVRGARALDRRGRHRPPVDGAVLAAAVAGRREARWQGRVGRRVELRARRDGHRRRRRRADAGGAGDDPRRPRRRGVHLRVEPDVAPARVGVGRLDGADLGGAERRVRQGADQSDGGAVGAAARGC